MPLLDKNQLLYVFEQRQLGRQEFAQSVSLPFVVTVGGGPTAGGPVLGDDGRRQNPKSGTRPQVDPHQEFGLQRGHHLEFVGRN